MKGGGVGRGKGGGGSSSYDWVPDPDSVKSDYYDFGHYYDAYGGNMSYDDWYESFDPCQISHVEPYYTEEKISLVLQQWFPPILIIIGLIGNTLSTLILVSAGKNRLSCFLYLAIIGIVDSLVLLTRSSSDWLRSVALVDITSWILQQNNATCSVYSFFTSALNHMCNWLLVLPLAEMALIARNFERAHKICTPSRVKHTILLLGFFIVFINTHFFFTYSLLGPKWDPLCGNYQCTFTPGGYGETFRDWLWPILGDNIVALLGPMLFVFLCLVCIVITPCTSEKYDDNFPENHFIMDNHGLHCFRMICIALAIFFLCTAIPEASYNLYEFFLEKSGSNEFTEPISFARRELIGTGSSFLRDVFLSTKVFLYVVCWNHFRKDIFCISNCLPGSKNNRKTNGSNEGCNLLKKRRSKHVQEDHGKSAKA